MHNIAFSAPNFTSSSLQTPVSSLHSPPFQAGDGPASYHTTDSAENYEAIAQAHIYGRLEPLSSETISIG